MMSSRNTLKIIAVLAGLLAGVVPSLAGNAAVTNAVLTETAGNKRAAQFDLAWDGSWRDGASHDACWVFVKYSIDKGVTWRHADLAVSGVNPAGFSSGSGIKLDIVVPADKKGAFIRRAQDGTGAVVNVGVNLLLASGSRGVPSAKALLKVFAVEMVSVAAGSFHLGTPNGKESGKFHAGADANTPFLVQAEGRITISNAPGCLWGAGDVYENKIGAPGILPAAFPKGFAAFYLMKMEISQRQYCDFLNTLTARQQDNRHAPKLNFGVIANDINSRNFIKKTGGSPAFFGCDANNNAGAAVNANAAKLNETNDAEWVACNWISWMDLAAYLDWAALRPMTELEFEKACRGPLAPLADEYAWGNAALKLAPLLSLKDPGTVAEMPNGGNCNVGQHALGPFRCGSYAELGSGRTNTGAGYCGALDLSGNVWERTVTAGNEAGRAFTGLHGDGNLTINGHADVVAWPGLKDGEVTDAFGAGARGGYWMNKGGFARVSDRSYAAAIGTARHNVMGGRGARLAP